MLKLIVGIAVGGAIGALVGASRSCETGACPLTANPYRGALYGGLVGFLVVSTFGGMSPGVHRNDEESLGMSTTSNTAVFEVSSREEFESQVLKAEVPVLVDLWAPWCAPCRAQMPIVEQVAHQAGERAKVVKINVDEAPDLAEALRVSSIPTLLVFRAGQISHRFVGVQSADVLVGALGF